MSKPVIPTLEERLNAKVLPDQWSARSQVIVNTQDLRTPTNHAAQMNLPRPKGNLLRYKYFVGVPVVTAQADDYLMGLRFRNNVQIIEGPEIVSAPIKSVPYRGKLQRVVIPVPAIGLTAIDDGG